MSFQSCQGSVTTTSKPVSPLLALPDEIRNKIYDYLLEPPDLKPLFDMHVRTWRKMDNLWTHSLRPSVCFFRPRVEALVTPAILLLNRQINVEAVSILRSKPLVINSPAPHCAQLGRDLWITEFISKATLRKLNHVVLEIDLSLHSWLDTISTLFDVWDSENNLKSLHVRIKWMKDLRVFGLIITHDLQDEAIVSTVSLSHLPYEFT